MIVDQMKQIPGVVAVGLTEIGVATDNNNNTGLIPPGATSRSDRPIWGGRRIF